MLNVLVKFSVREMVALDVNKYCSIEQYPSHQASASSKFFGTIKVLEELFFIGQSDRCLEITILEHRCAVLRVRACNRRFLE